MILGDTLVRLDQACDFIPILGWHVNQIHILHKCITLPLLNYLNPDIVRNNHYLYYIQSKSIVRCVMIGIAVPALLSWFTTDYVATDVIRSKRLA